MSPSQEAPTELLSSARLRRRIPSYQALFCPARPSNTRQPASSKWAGKGPCRSNTSCRRSTARHIPPGHAPGGNSTFHTGPGTFFSRFNAAIYAEIPPKGFKAGGAGMAEL